MHTENKEKINKLKDYQQISLNQTNKITLKELKENVDKVFEKYGDIEVVVDTEALSYPFHYSSLKYADVMFNEEDAKELDTPNSFCISLSTVGVFKKDIIIRENTECECLCNFEEKPHTIKFVKLNFKVDEGIYMNDEIVGWCETCKKVQYLSNDFYRRYYKLLAEKYNMGDENGISN